MNKKNVLQFTKVTVLSLMFVLGAGYVFADVQTKKTTSDFIFAGNIVQTTGSFLMSNVYSNSGLKYMGNGYGSMIRLNNGSGNIEFNIMSNNTSGADAPVSSLPINKVVITSTGRVGIGTVMPNSTLQVASGDIYTSAVGKGFIAKSPNGALCKRIGIDNLGNIVATPIICP
jgi:hypothetical protein